MARLEVETRQDPKGSLREAQAVYEQHGSAILSTGSAAQDRAAAEAIGFVIVQRTLADASGDPAMQRLPSPPPNLTMASFKQWISIHIAPKVKARQRAIVDYQKRFTSVTTLATPAPRATVRASGQTMILWRDFVQART